MNKFVSIFTFFSLMLCAFGQPNADQVQSRIEGTNRTQSSLPSQTANSPSTAVADTSESDTGAQRPVSLTDGEISAFFGYDTKYFYRSNPLAQDGDLSQVETDMWTNTFFAGLSSVIESDKGVYTPYINSAYTVNDYLIDDLGDFNYNTSHISTGLFSYYGGTTTYYAKIDYNMDKSTEFDTEDFSEFFPQIGMLTSFQPSKNFALRSTFGFGYHYTKITAAGSTRPEDLLDNFEVYALLSPSIPSFPLLETVGLTYRLSYQNYDNGSYSNREDFSHSILSKYELPLFESDAPDLYLYSVYSLRNSNDNTFDYKSVDAGFGLSLMARF